MSLKWYAPGQNVGFFNTKVHGGMVYVSSGPMPWPGEPSAIDTTLPITRVSAPPSEDLGYYPTYDRMSPAQRRCYLDWLAAGRRDAHPEARALGYLFLFYYGLERRIILDGDANPELIAELVALLQHYGPAHPSRSLRGFFLSLLHLAGWKTGPNGFRHLWPKFMELDNGRSGGEPMKLVLANMHDLGEHMHWTIAYRLAMGDPASKRSVVVTKSREEFWHLFQARYDAEYPEGLELKAAKQPALFRHQPGSTALMERDTYRREDPLLLKVPNVLGLHSQFKKIPLLWNSCVEDLSGYNRVKASKKTTDAVGLRRWVALPGELRTPESNPMREYWEWVDANAPEEDGTKFVSIGSLAAWFGMEERAKLTRSQSLEIAHALAAMGWEIAPHVSHTDVPYTWEQEVGVYRVSRPGCHEPQIAGLVRLLYLVMPLAASDGVVDPEELETFHGFIAHEFHRDADALYFSATERALLRDTNVAARALTGMTRHVTPRNRNAILRILIRIAAADGEISPEEMKLLRRISRAFGLPPELPEEIIREDVSYAEVVVSTGKKSARAGEPIPRKEEVPRGLVLDMERVKALTAETHEVVALLSVVMDEDEIEEAAARSVTPRTEPTVVVHAWMGELAPQFHGLVLLLRDLDEIASADFARMASTHHLLPEAALHAINAWADDHLGDFLLGATDPIPIYRDLFPADN